MSTKRWYTRFSEFGRIQWRYTLADFTPICAFVDRVQYVESTLWSKLYLPACNDDSYGRRA